MKCQREEHKNTSNRQNHGKHMKVSAFAHTLTLRLEEASVCVSVCVCKPETISGIILQDTVLRQGFSLA